MSDESKDDKIFFTPFEDKNASDKPPIPTELVRPTMNDFDFGKIGNFASILGTVNETGQTFRNVFNNSVSPSTIASLTKAGLTSDLSEILSKNGVSKFISGLPKTFNKTSYSYQESEKKLNKGANLELDFNPIGMFSDLFDRLKNLTKKSDSERKSIDQFYATVNQIRRIIFDVNGALYVNLQKIRSLHKEVNLESDFESLNKIFWSEEVYSVRYNIRQQIKNFNYAVEEYLKNQKEYVKTMRNKEDYGVCIDILRSQTVQLTSCLKYSEMKYVYEDLKLLRRTSGVEFKPISYEN